jgi:hypothetical protein
MSSKSKTTTKYYFSGNYLPKTLTRRDRSRQRKALQRSRKLYHLGKYYQRPKIWSFASKPSRWVRRAKKEFGVDAMIPSNALAKASGCSVKAMKHIIDKGEGAYYSSGSRPNQTAASWSHARLASALIGGPAAKSDWHIINNGCKKGSKTRRLVRRKHPKLK